MPYQVDPNTGKRIQITQPAQGGAKVQTPSGMETNNANTGSQQIYNLLRMSALQNPGSTTATRLLEQAEKFKPAEKTAEEKKAERARKQAEDTIKTIENFYFGNKLYYGFTPKGITESLRAKVTPNTPLARYNRFIKSKGVFLQKAAGDTGNIAWSEQQAQLKALASGLHDYESAKDAFDLMREGFGLDKRDYSSISPYKKDIESLINQFGGK